jgi:putative SOS response-associated peptidase YedK
MCGRYALTRPDFQGLLESLGATAAPESAAIYKPRYNVAPGQSHWLIRLANDERRLEPATWGFSHLGPRRVVNARCETVVAKPTFRELFEAKRCAIAADGFFEWGGNDKEPVWFHGSTGAPLLLAALYREPPGEPMEFVIITTPANAQVEPLHDRMPALIPPSRLDLWLSDPCAELLVAAPPEVLAAVPVSSRVNSVKNDDPECLAPATGRPRRQLRLL